MAAPIVLEPVTSMDLDFLHIECEVVSSHSSINISAPLHEALWAIEDDFRTFCCSRDAGSCLCCLEYDCLYRKIFARQLSPDPEIVRLHQKPSLPFSLYIDDTGDDYSSCIVGLVVIGNAMQHAELFLRVLLKVINKKYAELVHDRQPVLRLCCLDCQGNRHFFSEVSELAETAVIHSARNILDKPVNCDRMSIVLKSPLRLLSCGSVARSFDFAAFVRSQMRRCSSLVAYYGTGSLQLDFKSMSRSVQDADVIDDETVYCQPFWSNRPGRSGLVGTVECLGLSEPVISLLILGSYFNAGKGAACGAGHYQIKVV